jgi:type IV pilus assembly protein PilW
MTFFPPLLFSARSTRGFTLTEFMIAMALGLLLIAGVIHVYVASISSWRVNDDLARMQESGRVAIDMLERDLRMAAYKGCAREDDGALSSVLSGTARAEWEKGFWVKQNGTTRNLELSFRTPREGILKLASDVSAGTNKFTLADNAYSQAIHEKDFFVLGDCGKSELFDDGTTIRAVGSAVEIDRTASFTNSYYKDSAQLLALVKNSYKHEYDNTEKSWVLKRNDEVLASNVDVFRICYAEADTTGSKLASEFKKVDAASINWNKVGTIQINLVLAAEAAAAVDKSSSVNFVLCDGKEAWAATEVPQDTKLRKFFSTTVHLRNKLL